MAEASTPTGELVQLYIYDLSNGMARTFSQMLLGRQIDAIFHTSIAIGGWEHYFGGAWAEWAEVEKVWVSPTICSVQCLVLCFFFEHLSRCSPLDSCPPPVPQHRRHPSCARPLHPLWKAHGGAGPWVGQTAAVHAQYACASRTSSTFCLRAWQDLPAVALQRT